MITLAKYTWTQYIYSGVSIITEVTEYLCRGIVYRNSLVFKKMSVASYDVMDGMPMQTLVKRQNFLNYYHVEIILLNF